MTISKFSKLTKQDVDALLKLNLAKIDCQNIFLYMTQVPLHKYHVPLVEKIMKIVPIYSYEVKQIMDDRYLENFVYREEKKERVLLEPIFEEKRKKRRNDEKKHIRRANKIEAKAKAVNVVAEKKEYKKKIDDMYRKIRSQK